VLNLSKLHSFFVHDKYLLAHILAHGLNTYLKQLRPCLFHDLLLMVINDIYVMDDMS
jgi:hypothetical protein